MSAVRGDMSGAGKNREEQKVERKFFGFLTFAARPLFLSLLSLDSEGRRAACSPRLDASKSALNPRSKPRPNLLLILLIRAQP